MHAPYSIQNDDALLNEVQAAKRLNLSTRTLQAWRVSGRGPAFVRAGRAIRYRCRDLTVWIEVNTVPASGGDRA
jgi:hypothetical protein